MSESAHISERASHNHKSTYLSRESHVGYGMRVGKIVLSVFSQLLLGDREGCNNLEGLEKQLPCPSVCCAQLTIYLFSFDSVWVYHYHQQQQPKKCLATQLSLMRDYRPTLPQPVAMCSNVWAGITYLPHDFDYVWYGGFHALTSTVSFILQAR